ncbi:MAG: DEAD/DEAH box helicase [Candidatus Altiarchaeales archaeon]|nr:DEAD/DEAH box helicase [Candidatus Altiarchaeales archaeon]MBD3417194.1 DEAD/DEAH box helicase [Candidatus Altiarchaeales archaeon]
MLVEHPLIRRRKLELRRYQETVIARAVEDNTLVVLPTGLGKTIVAVVVAAHRLHKYPQSKVLFLAPTKPLVVQHRKTFEDFLTLEEMCVMTGNDPVNKREEMWDENRVIFATPQTIENDIIRGLDLSDVSLIIFDEAHRAVGDYSYVAIAKEYIEKSSMPLTLALTASPSSQREKVAEICRNLHVKYVEAKTDRDMDVKPYIQDVKVRWVRVELPGDFKGLQKLLQDVLRDEIKRLKDLGYLESANMSKVNKRVLLGIQHEVRREITSGGDAYSAASTVASAIKVNHGIELLETQGISALDEYFRRLRSQKSKAVKKLMADYKMMKAMVKVKEMRKNGVEHPKLDEMARIVKKYKGKKVLVFTQYRDSVESIIYRLNEEDILAHEFIGQQARGVKKGMSQSKQVKVLERFREGAYTALVATSVAEEGLDIPKVDAVVFYEPVPSEIRTIQRRGRTGRSATGEVYVLIAKGTRDEGYYWASTHKERRMGDIVRDMRRGLDEQAGITEYEGEGGVEEGELADDNETGEDVEAAVGVGQQSLITFTKEKDDRLKVYVDVRERNSTILSALREKCDVELKQLPVGDFLLSDRVCVERKTMGDFLQSLVDKRLMAQVSEMRRNFQIPILMLEGVDELYAQRNIHPNAVRGAMASIAVDFDMPIIPTEDEEDTAQMLIALAKREQEDNRRIVALRGERKPELLKERQRYIVESLPNVSAVLADRLLERFGSVEAVITAQEKKLMETEGIGSKKASDIRKVVKSKYK